MLKPQIVVKFISMNTHRLPCAMHEILTLIWRLLLVRSDNPIAISTFQIAMAWADAHLHRFRIRGKDFGISRIGGIGFRDDRHQVRLADIDRQLKRIKWYLWHGNMFRVPQVLDGLLMDLEDLELEPETEHGSELLKAVSDFRGHIAANRPLFSTTVIGTAMVR